jgi:probable rRNA maturation factor
MKRAAGAGMKIDVLVETDRWHKSGSAKATIRRALEQAAATLSAKTAEVAIVLTDDAAMRILNRNWRGVDAATNVLAFPARNVARMAVTRHSADRVGGEPGCGNHLRSHSGNHPCKHLGDIVLAYETVTREAHRDGKPLDHHLAHLAVHGFLHLLGYDHVNDAQARRMETTERIILRDLAVPDPYRTSRSSGHAGHQAAKRPRKGRARRAENA